MIEFALVSITLFAVFFALIDFARFMHANTSVAEAARQGARQGVANALGGDSPFGGYSGPCSGVALAAQATGAGCLGDRAIQSTVASVLSSLTSTVNVTNRKAADCTTPGPAVASLCIWPDDSASAGAYADCASARAALGHDPLPGELGSRKAEWTNPKYKGCFQIQVTVIYRYAPITPGLGVLGLGPLGSVASSTTMLAEY